MYEAEGIEGELENASFRRFGTGRMSCYSE